MFCAAYYIMLMSPNVEINLKVEIIGQSFSVSHTYEKYEKYFEITVR